MTHPLSAKEAATALKPHIGQLACSRLGDPTHRTQRELRFRRKGSFVVDLEQGIWCDHDPAGNESIKGGDALDLIAYLDNTSLKTAIESANRFLGHTPAQPPRFTSGTQDCPTKKERIEFALKLWTEGKSTEGTLAETYLRNRGITCRIPLDLKFHPGCWHSEAKSKHPALLALYRDISSDDSAEAVGVQVTYLKPDGSGKANVTPNRRMHGRMKNAAIKLTPDDEVTAGLGIAEGCETALSILSIGWRPMWAVGSEGAIASFPIMGGVESLTVFADHDNEGGHGIEKARACVGRWRAAGREASIMYPRGAGLDWNDVLRRAA